MQHIHRRVLLPLILGSLFLTALILYAFTATETSANPTGFPPGAQSALATTTVSYMTAGTATTTVVYDAYGQCGTNETNTGSTYAADSAALLMQFAGSSTSAVLNAQIEYSQNCQDWYQNNLGNTGGFNIASTSNTVNNTIAINNVQNFSWTFASTTQGGIAVTNANSATSTKIIHIPTPTRAVRVVFSLAAGSTNGALWAQIIPKKQNK